MSDTQLVHRDIGAKRTWLTPPRLVWLITALALLVAPLYLDQFWLQLGVSAGAVAVGAIGLNLVTGTAGQLSLAHPFFMALGGLTYVVMSSEPSVGAEGQLVGLGLHPVLGMVGGVLIAGLAGLIFAPVSGRLKGIYLGMASLGLVLIGVHVLNTATALSGGFNGRRTPPFELFGIRFDYDSIPILVLGVPFQRLEWLWCLSAVLLLFAWWFARNVVASRPGRAMQLLAVNEVAASVMGVNVMAYKAQAFWISSVYAGLAGVLFVLAIGSIAPQSFGLDLSIQFFAIIVIGGLGSVGGSIAGAVFVVALPVLIQGATAAIPFLSDATSSVSTGHIAKYIYGLAIILVLLFKPTGLAGIFHDVRRRLTRNRHIPAHEIEKESK